MPFSMVWITGLSSAAKTLRRLFFSVLPATGIGCSVVDKLSSRVSYRMERLMRDGKKVPSELYRCRITPTHKYSCALTRLGSIPARKESGESRGASWFRDNPQYAPE